MANLEFEVNGRRRRLDVDPDRSLLSVLRDDLLGKGMDALVRMIDRAEHRHGAAHADAFGVVPLAEAAGVMVGQRERIVVVEVQDTWLVVGVTPAEMTLLHSLPKGELPESTPPLAAPELLARMVNATPLETPIASSDTSAPARAAAVAGSPRSCIAIGRSRR